MVTILNRARMMTDSSSEAVAKAKEALRAAGIQYFLKPVQNHTALGKAIHTRAGVGAYGGGMSASSFSDQISYVYFLYVRKKDLEKARKLCNL